MLIILFYLQISPLLPAIVLFPVFSFPDVLGWFPQGHPPYLLGFHWSGDTASRALQADWEMLSGRGGSDSGFLEKRHREKLHHPFTKREFSKPSPSIQMDHHILFL